MNISVEVSTGEFLDKLSILTIKSERIQDAGKLVNINHELTILRQTWQDSGFSDADIRAELDQLKKANETLWDIEDKIRTKESQASFDDEFVELARSVYITNDQRADIKRRINTKLGSDLIEEKSYVDY